MDLLKEKLFSKCNDKFEICETQSELGGDIEGTRAFHEFCVLYGLIEEAGLETEYLRWKYGEDADI